MNFLKNNSSISRQASVNELIQSPSRDRLILDSEININDCDYDVKDESFHYLININLENILRPNQGKKAIYNFRNCVLYK